MVPKHRGEGSVTSASSSFPVRAFLFMIGAVCAGLALNAGLGYRTLSRFHMEYLNGQGRTIAVALESQVRGVGRRSRPEYWQSLLDEQYPAYRENVAFIALVDGANNVLAGITDGFEEALPFQKGFNEIGETGIYVFELALTSQGRQRDRTSPISDWNLRIGLYSSSADFIRNQAVLQVAVAAIGIVTLLGLTFYFLGTLKRFLALKSREESERHLAYLGTMAATLAHEIRNPLGAMKGLTQLVQEDLPPEHSAQEMMRTVVGEAERLEGLITDLLMFARPRDPEVSRFDLLQLIDDVISELQPSFDASGVKLMLAAPQNGIPVFSDRNGLRQILLNVLLNALEATSAQGKVMVTVEVERSIGTLMLHIDDTGHGLGDRDPEEFFQPFTSTKTKGTGLGLAVSRQIAERLGGSLMMSNRPEQGARCTLKLPIERD